MARATDLSTLRSHLPPAAYPIVEQWLRQHPVAIRIARTRATKLGDYRVASGTKPHRISVNRELNPYTFLVVLVHEIAHYHTFLKFRRHQPHGKEWKAEYKLAMRPFMSPVVFPEDVLRALDRHLVDAPSSSCTDHALMRILRRYDPEPKPFLEELRESTIFRFNRKLFVKGNELRTRYRCRCLNDRRIYLIDRMAEVHVEKPIPTRLAS
jgi:predicted SprT family Zn-dependent metalloprotease